MTVEVASSPALSQMKPQAQYPFCFTFSETVPLIMYKSDHLSFLSQPHQVYSSDKVFGHSTIICMSHHVLWRETQTEFTRIPVSPTTMLYFPGKISLALFPFLYH